MVDLGLLRASELCAGLDSRELERVAGLTDQGSAVEGQIIHSESQEAEELYLLTHGAVVLGFMMPGRGGENAITVSRVLEGGFFGWSALVPPHRYTLTATCALQPCRFLRLKRGPLLALFRREPAIGYKVMRNLAGIMGRRFRGLQEELVRDLGHDALHGW